jgi:SAM-dependent methyltransferase
MKSNDSWHLNCSLNSLALPRIRHFCLGTDLCPSTNKRYPLRLLRYWFIYHLLKKESSNSKRNGNTSLAICEIGIDRGQMRHFVAETEAFENSGDDQAWISKWDAVDVILQPDNLRGLGYGQLTQHDLEQDKMPDHLQGQYDVIILLHILEHLQNPEAALEKVLTCLKPGGIVMGGMPVLPNALVSWRERRLRRKARPFGHVSAFSPQRIHSWSERMGLHNEFCSGAFFMRSKWLPLEKWSPWVRFNLWFGAMNPWWPGEIYWSFRKTG